MEDTVIKGVIQIMTTAHHLKQNNMVAEHNIYGIIVTYKEYLIGDGQRFWDDVIKDHVTQKCEKSNIDICIRPEHLFCVSIEDFDYLMAGAKENNVSVSSVLNHVAQENASVETRCILLKTHLERLWNNNYYKLPFVRERVKQLCEAAKRRSA